jgi:mannose-1-phosphate guanylyltransferase
VDLTAIAAAHEASGALVTMAVSPAHDPARYGGVLVGAEGVIEGFTCAGTSRPAFHFVGVQMVSASVFSALPAGRPVESVGELYPPLIAGSPGAIRAFVSEAPFRDIGTAADYLRTSLAVAREEGLPGVQKGRNASIGAGACLERCVLWDDVTIGDGSRIVECVIADGVKIESGSCFERCAIINGEGHEPARGERKIGALVVAPIAVAPGD